MKHKKVVFGGNSGLDFHGRLTTGDSDIKPVLLPLVQLCEGKCFKCDMLVVRVGKLKGSNPLTSLRWQNDP